MDKHGQSDLLAITILVAVVIGIGLFLFGLLSGYSGIYRLKSMEEVNAEALVLRSLISADYVFYGDAYLRNIGKEPVVIFRLITLNNGTIMWDSGIREIITLGVGELGKVSYQCPSCREGDPIVLQVHYIPEKLFDPSNPELINPTSDVMLYKVASFPAENIVLGLAGACPALSNWVWVDFVDPVEAGQTGALSNMIKLRLSKASTLKDITLNIMVRDDSGGTAEGSKTLPSMSDVDEIIELRSASGVRYPAEVFLDIEDPDWVLVQNRWYFGRDLTAYIDLVKILWNSFNYRTIEVFVKAFHRDSGLYKIDVRIYDCFDRLIAEGSNVKEVHLGGGSGVWEEYSVALDHNPLISDVYRVEVYVTDISPLVTETRTETVTRTETTTLTLTSTSTLPLTTLTITSTSTSTTTRWITVATVTRTSTVTRTTTITPTTITTTRTVTAIIPSTTRTVTRTDTSTVSRTVATATVTSTLTSTSTVATVTQTATTTVGATITTTRTVTTTTTVPSVGGVSDNLGIEIMYVGCFLIASPLVYVCRRWRR